MSGVFADNLPRASGKCCIALVGASFSAECLRLLALEKVPCLEYSGLSDGESRRLKCCSYLGL